MENKLTSAHLMFKMYVLNTYSVATLSRERDGDWVLFGIKHQTTNKKVFVWVPKHIEAKAQPGTATTITLDQLLSQLPTATLREFVAVNRYIMSYASESDTTNTFGASYYSYAPAKSTIFDALDKECLYVMAIEGASVDQSATDLSVKYASLYAAHADLLAKYEKIKKVFE